MIVPDEPREKVGAGWTAEIFAHGEGQVVKLYFPWVPIDWRDHEAKSTRMAHESGLPVPKVYEVISDGERHGIVMERIDGPMMISSTIRRFWKTSYYASVLAGLQAKVNALTAPELPPLRPRLDGNIRNESHIPDGTKEAVLEILDGLPDDDNFCHFDIHPLNVIMSPGGPFLIDWSGAAKADPMADLARTWLLCTHPPIPPQPIRSVFSVWLRYFYSRCIKEYSRLTTVSKERYERWKIPIIAARLPEEKKTARKQYLLKVLDKHLKTLNPD